MQFILNNQNALPGKCEEAALRADWQGTKVNLLQNLGIKIRLW
jgi:hypothetical protein